ncbi:hypothetical protein B5M09_003427 [Aphanomyces astaci]|uniref:Uncharacterized protein n=1 Tax=Aphanomyces astaci TaxID=112090 RepID=A0A3R7YC84_APHAT|nr:hypothetical protein B5M09_003427 [Aphanomyces astaci]
MTSRTLRRAVAVPRPNACRGWVKEDAPYNAEICAQTKLQVLNVYANESPVSCDTGKTCLIVTMMYSFFNPGYLEAAIANNNIPAYFCFSGYDSMEAVTDVMNKNDTVTFYHCEPDLFHLKHEGKLQRIALSNVVATATGGFGERGY